MKPAVRPVKSGLFGSFNVVVPHNKCAMEADQPATSAEEQRLREALGRIDPDKYAATLMDGGYSKIEEVAAIDLATIRQDVPLLRAGAAARIMHSLSRTGLSHSSNLEDSHYDSNQPARHMYIYLEDTQTK